MSDTLEALHAVVVANPADRTVRLVYADALDETGIPADAAQAAFVRAQFEYENSVSDIHRLGVLAYQCHELFEANWVAWWRPVAAAAGLPEPHVPGKRVRDRVARATSRRPRRARNWPYTAESMGATVHAIPYGLSFRFAAGFPEEVRVLNFDTPEGGLKLVHRWGDAIPLTRLAFSGYLTRAEWERVDGPHLARLAALTFDGLTPDAVPAVVGSPYLGVLTSLTVNLNPAAADADAARAIVALPAWENLRTLRVTGRLGPAAVRAVAHGCTLKHLEELDLSLGNPGLFGSPFAELAGGLFQGFLRMVAIPLSYSSRWIEFGPALESLAAAPWVRRLRVLRIQSGHHGGLLSEMLRAQFGEQFSGGTEAGADLIPDAAVLALAAAVGTDKLDKLELPAAVVAPSVREELTARLGQRVAFA